MQVIRKIKILCLPKPSLGDSYSIVARETLKQKNFKMRFVNHRGYQSTYFSQDTILPTVHKIQEIQWTKINRRKDKKRNPPHKVIRGTFVGVLTGLLQLGEPIWKFLLLFRHWLESGSKRAMRRREGSTDIGGIVGDGKAVPWRWREVQQGKFWRKIDSEN